MASLNDSQKANLKKSQLAWLRIRDKTATADEFFTLTQEKINFLDQLARS
jgi:uncharacterized protein YecT (DUF1311 family)